MITVGTWLTSIDEAVLDFYAEHDLELTPKAVHKNIAAEPAYNSTKRRMRKLADAGFLVNDEGYYSITELGLKVANDEFNREQINELEPERD